VTTLGPAALPTAAPFDAASERFSVLHFENDSFAVAVPAPVVMLNVLAGFLALSEPLNVCVCIDGGDGDGGGGGAGAEATSALGADEALAEPEAFDAVTTAKSVEPTSAVAATYDEDVAPTIGAQFAPAESHRCHW